MDLVLPDNHWDRKRNQSKEHNELKHRCLRWLGNRATFSGIFGRTEMPMKKGFVADAFAMGMLQYRFIQEYIQQMGFESVYKYARDNDIRWVFVFEAKASRSDYLRDFGKKGRKKDQLIGNLNWIVIDKGVAKPEEVPPDWGLLVARGAGLTEIKEPRLQKLPKGRLEKLALDLFWVGQLWRTSHRCLEIPVCPDCGSVSPPLNHVERKELKLMAQKNKKRKKRGQ